MTNKIIKIKGLNDDDSAKISLFILNRLNETRIRLKEEDKERFTETINKIYDNEVFQSKQGVLFYKGWADQKSPAFMVLNAENYLEELIELKLMIENRAYLKSAVANVFEWFDTIYMWDYNKRISDMHDYQELSYITNRLLSK